jgi:antitoxin ParD1/3/4
MKIEIKPEDEQLIQKRLQSGAFHSIDEVIHDALTSQDAEEEWLQENKEAINAKISRGLAQLDSGEGVSGDVARARLQERKAAWLAEHKRS